MQWDQLSLLNPNYLFGCQPFNLHSYFEDSPFFGNLDSTFPFNLTQPVSPSTKVFFSAAGVGATF